MSTALNLYPNLTDELTVKMGYVATNYAFSYGSEGLTYPLDARLADVNNNEVLLISDDRNEWSPETHDLTLSRSLTIHNPHFLFGPNGLACESAELGLALLWTSKSSKQQGIEVIGGFRKKAQPLDFDIQFSFPSGFLRGRLNLQIIIYLKTPGAASRDEKHLANEAGVILGILDNFTVVLDGSGSVFPIVEVSEPTQPLWWVRCDWMDPQIDLFEEENVQICLNSAHPDFKLLKLDGSFKDSVLLKEIISSSLQIIIQKVQESESWDEIIIGKNCEQGSIAHAVHYLINTFDWDTNSPERLAMTIRKYMDSIL